MARKPADANIQKAAKHQPSHDRENGEEQAHADRQYIRQQQSIIVAEPPI